MLLLIQNNSAASVGSTWTLDGWAGGWPGGWTLDGWPTLGQTWTLDGWVPAYGSGSGSAGSGNMLGLLFPLNLELPPAQNLLVQATADGYYHGLFHPKDDIFYISNITDFSDSSVSLVPVGNPDYPVYGWMRMVAGTQEFDQAESLQSWPRNYIKRTVL